MWATISTLPGKCEIAWQLACPGRQHAGFRRIWPYARAEWESNMITSHRDLLERVQALTWVHSIDLGNGIVTPGMWGPPSPTIMRALDTIDFRGKKVLDIGCWDGLWSFEAEKRGATTVVATDLNTQRWPPDGHLTFMLAHEALASKAIYRSVSMYDVRAPSPIAISTSCSSAAYTTICAIHCSRCRGAKCGAEFFYKNPHSNDPSNWWVPTVRCLHEWVESSYFDLVQEFLPPQADGR